MTSYYGALDDNQDRAPDSRETSPRITFDALKINIVALLNLQNL